MPRRRQNVGEAKEEEKEVQRDDNTILTSLAAALIKTSNHERIPKYTGCGMDLWTWLKIVEKHNPEATLSQQIHTVTMNIEDGVILQRALMVNEEQASSWPMFKRYLHGYILDDERFDQEWETLHQEKHEAVDVFAVRFKTVMGMINEMTDNSITESKAVAKFRSGQNQHIREKMVTLDFSSLDTMRDTAIKIARRLKTVTLIPTTNIQPTETEEQESTWRYSRLAEEDAKIISYPTERPQQELTSSNSWRTSLVMASVSSAEKWATGKEIASCTRDPGETTLPDKRRNPESTLRD